MDLYKGSSLFLLDLDECSIHQEGQKFYALSCITSPGGKHRGLAGSVAVLITESLLMLSKPYIQVVTGLCQIGMAIESYSRPGGHAPLIFFLNWFGRETGTKIRDYYATFGDRQPTELGTALDTLERSLS